MGHNACKASGSPEGIGVLMIGKLAMIVDMNSLATTRHIRDERKSSLLQGLLTGLGLVMEDGSIGKHFDAP